MQPIGILKKYRMLLVLAMIVLLPASGVLWALADSGVLLGLCIVISCLSVVVVFAEEVVATAISDEVTRLLAEVKQKSERITNLDETIREEDRILAVLEQQNNSARAELLAQSSHSAAA